MSDIFNQIVGPEDAETAEKEAWHTYKDRVSEANEHRAWAIRALEGIEDIKVYIAAQKAIEAAYDKIEAHEKAKYLAIRTNLGLPI